MDRPCVVHRHRVLQPNFKLQSKAFMLVYNGDTDPSINSFEAANWTTHLGFTPTQTWRPWTLDGCRRMGGYVTRYKERFDFLTIRGSGHMVPQERPREALTLLRHLLEHRSPAPQMPSDEKLAMMSPGEFKAFGDTWTHRAKSTPYVLSL